MKIIENSPVYLCFSFDSKNKCSLVFAFSFTPKSHKSQLIKIHTFKSFGRYF